VPLGALPDVSYDERSFDLHRGDVFVFCTDGVLEAVNPSGVEFGSRRLCEVILSRRDRGARAIVDGIFEAVVAFREGQPQNDDMTAVAVTIAA
jgi:sigma-B regulation protein RsbU (phosphoserine phosphatase)